jgi:hypothetical protein
MKSRRISATSTQRTRRTMNRTSYAELAKSVLLQPWFLRQRAAFAIRGLVPIDFQLKMRNVFDDYGCLLCGAESQYHSNGMCSPCYSTTLHEVLLSARRHASPISKTRLDLELFRQEKLAKKLLSRFAPQKATSPDQRRIRVVPCNPVHEALAARLEQSRKSS